MSAFFRSKHFIFLIACLTGLTALSLDALLPAFAAMSADFASTLQHENDIQLVIFVYILGFASMQIVYGILADRYGRKPMLYLGLGIYLLATASVFCLTSFKALLLARFCQGLGLGALRVMSQAVVRDVASGKDMARIMSYSVMVFMIIPILAPSLGLLVLKTGSWKNIFWFFLLAGIIMAVWSIRVLPETLSPDNRMPLTFKNIQSALSACFKHRPTLVYMMMNGALYGGLMSYIGQSEQILGRDVYSLGDKFPLVFAFCTSGMILSSFINTKLVMKFRLQQLVLGSLSLMFIVDGGLIISTIIGNGKPNLWFFIASITLHLMAYNLTMPNLNALMMEAHQKIAGTASSIIGTTMLLIGTCIAHLVASQFNGTVYPLALGLWLLSSVALWCLWSVKQLERKLSP
ncbi:MAG: multidrug effflux MFS transporter [Cardiobacteriaceae bacterium]|nr:multidrug effflux MFS transporter [Cardiobacteriaceae bacterium]